MTKGQIFERLSCGWKIACVLILVCAATAVDVQAQVFTTVASFDNADGAKPWFVPLAQGSDGNYYGTTWGGGSGACATYLGTGCGTVFKITPTGALTTLHSFCTQPNCIDGVAPWAGLVLATDGNFYGTAELGGANNYGVIFKITPEGALTTLYSFCAQPNCTDGANPSDGLIQATDGDFYGTTYGGGISGGCTTGGCGTVFKITPQGTLTTLYTFCKQNAACPDGANPYAGLIQATDGNFYGTTSYGGANKVGTVFKMTRAGRLTVLHSFNGADGIGPIAGVVQGADGNFYGTTYGGGSDSGLGTVFKITPNGQLVTLHTFCQQADCSDGSRLYAGVIQATDGNFYGATSWGGDLTCDAPNGCGTVFQVTPSGTLTTLHNFESDDGNGPYGDLFQATAGILYGTTGIGGAYDDGTIYSLDMGLGPFVTFVRAAGKVGQTGGILGQGFTGTTGVSLNGVPANFTVVSDTYIKATVPVGATTGYVTVTTPTGVLTSNVPFYVLK